MQPDFTNELIAAMPRLRQRASRLVARRPSLGAVDDLVQDTTVTALQSAERFTGGNLAAWLSAILEGHAKNVARKAWNCRTVSLTANGKDLDIDGDPWVEHDVPVPASQEIALECADVLQVLGTLSPDEQTIIRLARIEFLSYAEIADDLGLPLGTVQSRLSRAQARLRAACEAEPSAPSPPSRPSAPARRAA